MTFMTKIVLMVYQSNFSVKKKNYLLLQGHFVGFFVCIIFLFIQVFSSNLYLHLIFSIQINK